MSPARTLVIALAGLGALALLTTAEVEGRSNGITRRSGNPATGGSTCTACHSGGIAPSVTLASTCD